jgi:hypothetical protein
MLFELLTGAKPYVGNSAVEVMQQHVHGPRPPLPPELSAFEPLLDKFMARDRSRRFPDAVSAYAALMAAIDDLAAQAAPVAPVAAATAEVSGS